jgi:hypothetical protein
MLQGTAAACLTVYPGTNTVETPAARLIHPTISDALANLTSDSVRLLANRKYFVELLYKGAGAESQCRVLWARGDGQWRDIPSEELFPVED